jgi:hypothetical protein
MKKEEFYLGKKVSDLNVYERRFRKAMQLMRVHKMLEKEEKVHKPMPEDGHL